MNLCHLNMQFGVDTLDGAATLDWFDSRRTSVALDIPDLNLNLDVELHSDKPLDNSGVLSTYNDNELGVACLGIEGDWLTKPIILPCSQNGQRSDYVFPQPPYNPGFSVTVGEATVDFSTPSPGSVTSCFEFNDADISSILIADSSCFPDLPVILPTWHQVTDYHEVSTPPSVAGCGQETADSEVCPTSRSRKRDRAQCEKGDHRTQCEKGDRTPHVPGAAKDRKKEQNKSAALKYRQKKREEQARLEDRRDRLEEQNERLQSDAASLEKEIAYLRQLWQELHGKLQTL